MEPTASPLSNGCSTGSSLRLTIGAKIGSGDEVRQLSNGIRIWKSCTEIAHVSTQHDLTYVIY